MADAKNNNPKYFILDYTHEELMNILERVADYEGVSEERVLELINAAQFGNTDFSGYAKITYVDEKIANIELLEGPQGPQGEQGLPGEDGKDFTFDMFTAEQLEMLIGPKGDKGDIGPQGPQGMQGEQGEKGDPGEPGKDGINGIDGKDFTYDMFTQEQLEALRGPQGPEGPAGKDADPVDLEGYATEEYVQDAIRNIQVGEDIDLTDFAKVSYVDEQIAAIEHPQYDDSEIKDLINAKVEKVEGKVLIDEAEVERLANIDNYDDSELRVLIDEEKPYLADVAAYPTSKFLFACGQPMTVEPNVGHKYSADHAEDDVAFVYRWAEGFECIMVEKAVAEKVYLVGGFGHKNIGARRSIPQTNMVVRDVKIKGLVGGNYFEGMVGHVNIEAENCEFVAVMGGGWCGASVNGKATRMNVADDINIKMTNCKVSSTLFGGSQGNGVSDDLRMELNNCEIGWLTAGGANGMTRNAVVVMNGGSVKVAQSTNRGIVHKARFILNDGIVNKLYFGGETEDATVNGLIEDGFVELNSGTVKQFHFGTNNGVEMAAEEIKGCIMNCVVESGDVSMLEIKVAEEPEVDVDLSEYAKIEFVEEQIANIELTPGQDGADGVSVQNVAIDENNHLMVTLSDGQILDAGELPAGQDGGSADTSALEAELVETKQQLLDLTYGVEYEWAYEVAQTIAADRELPFNEENAPGFAEDWLPVLESGDDAAIEEFIVNMYEQDIYRMYVMRVVGDHRKDNRYELLPLEDHSIQPENTYLPGWTPMKSTTSWNWRGEGADGFFLDIAPTSPMVFVLMKVKEEYRGKF